ncbi:hypothetical protein BH11PAT4_BH11PAT4_6170 [soil metagenome]
MRRNIVYIVFTLAVALMVNSCSRAEAAQAVPSPTFQQTFDKLAKEKSLTAAARFTLKSTGEEGAPVTPMLDVLAGKPGDPERDTSMSFLRGIGQFARACGAEAFKPLFTDEGGIAPAETISLEEAVKRNANSLGAIESKAEENTKFMKSFPKEGTQIIEFTIVRKETSQLPGDLKLTLFFIKQKLEKEDVWRLRYAIATVARP